MVLIFGIMLFLTTPKALAQDDLILPNIFVWAMPEEVVEAQYDGEIKDISAIKSAKKNAKKKNDKSPELEDIILELKDDTSYNATTLKGYAEYVDATETVFLRNGVGTDYVLNIREPKIIAARSLINRKEETSPFIRKNSMFGKYNQEEYDISASKVQSFGKVGGFSFGSSYSSKISSVSQLEQETDLFTRYEYRNFALNSSFRKTHATANGFISDSVNVIPEIKLNSFFTIRDIYKSDITNNRTSNEVVLVINPFGRSDKDRVNFELGAGQTYDQNNVLMKTNLRFSTQFKF